MNLAVSLTCAPLMLVAGAFAVFQEELPQWVAWTVLGTFGAGIMGGVLVALVVLIVSEFADVRNDV